MQIYRFLSYLYLDITLYFLSSQVPQVIPHWSALKPKPILSFYSVSLSLCSELSLFLWVHSGLKHLSQFFRTLWMDLMEHIPTKKSVSELCVLFLLLLLIYSPQPHSTNLIANRRDNVLASFSYFFSCFFYFFDGCNNKLDSREFVMCAQNFHRNNNNSNYNKASKTETCLCSGFGFGFLGALTPRFIYTRDIYVIS